VAISRPAVVSEMEALTDSQRRFARIKADLAIIKWMLGFTIVALFLLLINH
jgi:hypothetical protein